MAVDDQRHVYGLFSELLDYPTSALPASAAESVKLLQDSCPDAARDIKDFLEFFAREGLPTMQEIYTRTFDITPTANLYVGYHLFGESFKRGAFLSRLHEEYARHGFSDGPELADHLSVVLKFASVVHDPEFVGPLLNEGVLPTVEKVMESLKEPVGYGLVIKALRCLVCQNGHVAAAGG